MNRIFELNDLQERGAEMKLIVKLMVTLYFQTTNQLAQLSEKYSGQSGEPR